MSLGSRKKKKIKVPKSVGKKVKISREVSDAVLASLPKSKQKGVDPHEFHVGMHIEMEHYDLTKGNLKKTAMITLAHLKELPDYNTRLKEMEEEGEEDLEKHKKKFKSRTFQPFEPKKEYEEKVEEYFEGFEPVEEEEGKEEYED
jgi:hypothetical protein